MTRRALLLHGLSSKSSGWWRVREHLESQGWRVTTPELLAHGGSSGAARYALADYVASLRDRADAATWDLVVGHSLGGAVALLTSSEDAAWASRLVLIDPVLLIHPAEFAAVIADQVAELELTDASIRSEHPLWHDRDVEAKLRGVRSVIPDAVSRTFTDTITARGAWDLRANAAALRVPTLVLAADPAVGTMYPSALADELAAANPLIRTRVIRGAGHSVHRDRPDEALAAISAFSAFST